MTPTINPSHAFAVYQYTDKVSDPYYIGKRFISSNQRLDEPASDRLIIVATADIIEECQQYLDRSPLALFEWLVHQDQQTGLTDEST